jgi:hypothetical protein
MIQVTLKCDVCGKPSSVSAQMLTDIRDLIKAAKFRSIIAYNKKVLVCDECRLKYEQAKVDGEQLKTQTIEDALKSKGDIEK